MRRTEDFRPENRRAYKGACERTYKGSYERAHAEEYGRESGENIYRELTREGQRFCAVAGLLDLRDPQGIPAPQGRRGHRGFRVNPDLLGPYSDLRTFMHSCLPTTQPQLLRARM